jgi:Holliday junction resolvase-like predicted endonuclease
VEVCGQVQRLRFVRTDRCQSGNQMELIDADRQEWCGGGESYLASHRSLRHWNCRVGFILRAQNARHLARRRWRCPAQA